MCHTVETCDYKLMPHHGSVWWHRCRNWKRGGRGRGTGACACFCVHIHTHELIKLQLHLPTEDRTMRYYEHCQTICLYDISSYCMKAHPLTWLSCLPPPPPKKPQAWNGSSVEISLVINRYRYLYDLLHKFFNVGRWR